MGTPLGAFIILNLRKFFTDCFQNLAQRFIGIQEYVNDIVFKKKKSPWAPWIPLNLKNPKVLNRLFLNFWTKFLSITRVPL